ncbi:hypothetical protein, partial [Streptomyces sp. M2CJ-2]|uniref:hypothetical protein n=1 Tax=Streptomyces sp. M2CJ-2 TaxID=2803948 RepID=UPI001F32B20F
MGSWFQWSGHDLPITFTNGAGRAGRPETKPPPLRTSARRRLRTRQSLISQITAPEVTDAPTSALSPLTV